MSTKEIGFFQVLGYFTLFVLLGCLTWANIFPLSNSNSLTIMAAVWMIVFIVAIILRLFSVRKSWSTAIETAWLSLLAFCWILILLDTGLCSVGNQPFCQPASMPILSVLGTPQELSVATYSLILISVVMSALCFPWGLPLVVLWLHLIPGIFALANLPAPDYFSPLGRFILFFPAILMTPIGYWLWFYLIPKLGSSTRQALRIDQIRSGSLSFATKTKKWTLSFAQKAKNSANAGLTKLKNLRKKEEENSAEDKKKTPPRKKPAARK